MPFLLSLLVLLIVAYISVAIAYLVGMLFAITPFVNEWLTEPLGLTTAQLPSVFAWIGLGFGLLLFVLTGVTERLKGGD